MAKRRLTRQQQRRINNQQQDRLKQDQYPLGETNTDDTRSTTARVISHHGRELFAETDDGKRVKCKIRQNLGEIACGDYVVIQQANPSHTSISDPIDNHANNSTSHNDVSHNDDSHNVVVAIKERTNLLQKTGFAGATKPVAANIGQIVIVTSASPLPNPYLVDRYLTAAENLPAKAVIIINKSDLITHDNRQMITDIMTRYEKIGYTVLTSSVKQKKGIADILSALSNTTSILVGLSGVGKSSIVKALLPKETIKIGDTSQATGEGKHTTTVSALYHLENNGIIIDSPGVRDFTPINNSVHEITHGFIDIRKFNGTCKFSNCSHHNEPGCALRNAVDQGVLDEQRFRNYLRLVQEFSNSQ